ncbi:DUF4150 domain-containing protein [Nannocystaceae bacterium ST9]
MAVTVGANFMSIVHAGSNGVTIAFPDICKTPVGPSVAPIPYPNIAKSGDSAKTAKKVLADGEPICTKNSNFSTSSGDEPGTLKGLASSRNMGKAEFVNYSMDVMAEGKNVARAFDLMLHNDKNTPPVPLLQGPVVTVPGLDKRVCCICDEEF